MAMPCGVFQTHQEVLQPVSAGLEVDPTATAPPEAVLQGPGGKIEGRSLGQIAWMRLRRDKVAMAGGAIVILLVIFAVLAPLIVGLLGHPPNEFHQELINADTQVPIKPWGVIAGYMGGWVDTLISRLMDIFLAFPLLVFALALAGVIPDQAFGLKGDQLKIAVIIFIIGFFNWPYIGRIIRGQTLSLREREFVDAARSLGARQNYILFKELLPNLLAPILVYSTLLIPSNILFEAALSYLGVGVQPPRATWGGMLSDATQWYQVDPEFILPAGLAIFVTVLAFNLFGDGLRDALDPRSR